MKKGFNSNLPWSYFARRRITDWKSTKQRGSSTANFQHSEEEEIIIEQSETQTLDACKLSMLVDLANVLSAMLVDPANVLSDIKPSKELGYDEIYQFYKNHFVPATNDQLAHTSVTKKCSTYKLYFKTN